jgi:hypothetical protein
MSEQSKYKLFDIESVPSDETIDEWEDENLTAAASIKVADLCYKNNFSYLNDTEKVIYCAMNFDEEVNNGGFEQFLYQTSTEVLKATIECLKEIDAIEMSNLVSESVSFLRDEDMQSDATKELALDKMPNIIIEKLNGLNLIFISQESAFLKSLYNYARDNWYRIRWK